MLMCLIRLLLWALGEMFVDAVPLHGLPGLILGLTQLTLPGTSYGRSKSWLILLRTVARLLKDFVYSELPDPDQYSI